MGAQPRPIFVSHATSDAPLVDDFVYTVLQLGLQVSPDEIFYSSGPDTRAPSGEDLIGNIKRNLVDAGLVVAVITPSFQKSSFCLTELGAAWSRTSNLFPVRAPGMLRDGLEGILSGLVVYELVDPATLDELHGRVARIVGSRSSASTWSHHKSRFLEKLRQGTPPTPPPSLPDEDTRQDLIPQGSAQGGTKLDRLIDAGVLAEGEPLTLVVPSRLTKVDSEAVEEWLREDPKRREVRWLNDRMRPVRWEVEETEWSLNQLIREIVYRATGQEKAGVWGFAWLRAGDGRTLARIVDGLPRLGEP